MDVPTVSGAQPPACHPQTPAVQLTANGVQPGKPLQVFCRLREEYIPVRLTGVRAGPDGTTQVQFQPPLEDPGLAWVHVSQEAPPSEEVAGTSWPLLVCDFPEVAEEISAYVRRVCSSQEASELGSTLKVLDTALHPDAEKPPSNAAFAEAMLRCSLHGLSETLDEVVRVADALGIPLRQLIEEADRLQPAGLLSGAVLSRDKNTVMMVLSMLKDEHFPMCAAARDSVGMTPLHWAALQDVPSIVQLLHQNCPDSIMAWDSCKAGPDRLTPSDMACQRATLLNKPVPMGSSSQAHVHAPKLDKPWIFVLGTVIFVWAVARVLMGLNLSCQAQQKGFLLAGLLLGMLLAYTKLYSQPLRKLRALASKQGLQLTSTLRFVGHVEDEFHRFQAQQCCLRGNILESSVWCFPLLVPAASCILSRQVNNFWGSVFTVAVLYILWWRSGNAPSYSALLLHNAIADCVVGIFTHQSLFGLSALQSAPAAFTAFLPASYWPMVIIAARAYMVPGHPVWSIMQAGFLIICSCTMIAPALLRADDLGSGMAALSAILEKVLIYTVANGLGMAIQSHRLTCTLEKFLSSGRKGGKAVH